VFGGAGAATGEDVLNPLFASGLQGFGRGFIAGKLAGFGGALAAAREAEHEEAAGDEALAGFDHLAGAHGGGGFGLAAVEVYAAEAAGLGCEGTGLVGAHGPEPFVEAGVVGRGGGGVERAVLRTFHVGGLRAGGGAGKLYFPAKTLKFAVMFAPFSRFRQRLPDPAEAEHAFVQEVNVGHAREPRSRRLEVVLAIGWVLVLAKCVAVWWACRAYAVPFNPWWLIGPTLAFASLCTWVYWRRD
jgi:hypothetical protein